MHVHPVERSALVDALRAAGPRAPTLCEGWSSEHLAAHVVLRERSPLAAAGIVLPPLAARTERLTQSVGDEAARTPAAWGRLLGQIADGPPLGRLHPLTIAGDSAQLVELFVHTEDVRRGGPAGRDVSPRPRSAEHTERLWQGLTRMAGLSYRRSGLRLVLDGGAGRRHVVGSGPEVVLSGEVGELLLHAFGRSAVAHVDADGDPDAVTRLHEVRPPR